MNQNSDYPERGRYEPPHPAFNRCAEVQSSSDPTVTHLVDLAEGTCTCPRGKAYHWNDRKGWISATWCSHKMRAAAIIIDGLTGAERDNAQAVYNRLLGERYIVWESVSAFHKELRRGDYAAAQYWALSVAAHRGLAGVAKYMLNVLFEESRDLDLYARLLTLVEKGRSVEYGEVMNMVRLFAESPKKWMLEGRLAIFTDEMRGYQRLAKKFGYEIAKGKDIIEYQAFDLLKKELVEGFQQADAVRMQSGLKGLFKSQHVRGHDSLKAIIFNILTDCLNDEGDFGKGATNAFRHNEAYARRVHSLVYRRFVTLREIGYHELNALGDALAGESYHDHSNTLPKARQRLILLNPKPYTPPRGYIAQIPLYALDNHNYRGKALMSRWAATELQPSAEQVNLDFRTCGAYMGVAWRYLAWNQYHSIDVPWGKVRWYPSWLWQHLDNMWYVITWFTIGSGAWLLSGGGSLISRMSSAFATMIT